MTECFTCLWISKGIRRSPGALTWSLWQLLWQSLPAVTQICYFPLIFPRCRGHNNLCNRAATKSVWSCQSLHSRAPQSLCFCLCAGVPLRTCISIYVVFRLLPLPLLKHNSAVLTEISARVTWVSPHPWSLYLLKELLWINSFPKHQLKQNPLSCCNFICPAYSRDFLHSRSPFPESRTGTAGVVLVSLQWNLITSLVAFLCLFDMVI